MRSPDAFDAFYVDTRNRLLLETYALTGDLHASRTAVQGAFSVAWHHWPKLARLDDPEAWVRPLAHGRAQRRHTARLWHRDRGIDDEVRATLEALSKLSSHERKALVLNTLSPLSLAAIAREIGLPQPETERALQTATSGFAMTRGVASTDVRSLLEALRTPVADTRWQRSTIVRRAGTARRRTHALVGTAVGLAAVLVSGTVVASGGAEPSTLAQESALPGVTVREVTAQQPPPLAADSLLEADQVERYGRGLAWSETRTSANLGGSGLVMPCQQARFADPSAIGALMRSFTGTVEMEAERRPGRTRRGGGKQSGSRTRRTVTQERATATEFVELSASEGRARASFRTARRWYAECMDARTQLLSTHTVSRIGDEATVLTLRTWSRTPARLTVGLARTGRLTVTTLIRSTGAPVDARTAASGLAAAVNAACGTTGVGVCAGPPRVRPSAPYPVGRPAGLLAAVDLPPVGGAVGPWVGTDPERARANFAATRCDNTQFRGRGMKHTLTRTFLFPARRKVDTFGLTQTVATMKPRQARSFVDQVRARIRQCGEAGLGTSVDTLVHRTGKHVDLTVWDLDFEISDNTTIQFWMGIMRDGNAVSQVGFTPAEGMTMARGDFTTVVERALERLSDLPSAQR